MAILADGIGSTHGVTRTIEEIRQRGVPGFEIEVVGTDPEVDLRLPAVAEIDVPYYPGLSIGVPSLPAAVQLLADGGFDAIHVCSPGPAGIAGVLVARALGLPLVGSYHTELTAYAGLRSGQQHVADAMALAVGAFYNACDVVLSPSVASDAALAGIGMAAEKIMRWDRGVDTARFDPALRGTRLLQPRRLEVLYSGRITREKGADLLAEAFLLARARDPRLHLVLAGGGPEQEQLAERLGAHATFLGWLSGAELARTYANADLFLFPSATDTFGQVILEAQASGLPVVAVAEGGPLSLIEDRVTGLLCEASAPALAEAVLELAASPLLRESLSRAALAERARAHVGAGLGAAGRGVRAGGRRRRLACGRERCRGEEIAADLDARAAESIGGPCGLSSISASPASKAPARRRWARSAPPPDRAREPQRARPPHDRGRPARHRARHVRALRAAARLAGRARRRPRHAARDPGARPAPAGRALAGDGRAGLARAAARATRSPSTASATSSCAAASSRARRSRTRAAGARPSSSGWTTWRRGARSTPAGAC